MDSALLCKSLMGVVVTLLTCNIIHITQGHLVRNTRSEHSYRYDDFFREMRIDGILSEIRNGNHIPNICYRIKFSTFMLLGGIVL